MKQGLSLRVSQHLALTPQLQQSIRLLQLSTLELNQEIEQMLGDNPFLEQTEDEELTPPMPAAEPPTAPVAEAAGDEASAAEDSLAEVDSPGPDDTLDWNETSDTAASDEADWGTTPAARGSGAFDDDDTDIGELAHSGETLTSWLHRQALALRLLPEDQAALHFLIESLNDDGYLEDALPALAAGLAPDDVEAQEEVLHRLTVALSLLQSLEPTGVGARSLAECLSLQLRAAAAQPNASPACAAAQRLCAQPMELLARRDWKRLAQLTGDSEPELKAALALITRLEPKPGRRFCNVERNIVVPDVLVTASGRGAQQRLRVQLNPDVMPRLRVHEIYAGALKAHKSGGHQALQQRLQEARWFIKNIQQRFDTILRVATAIVERQKNFFAHGELAMRPLVLREIADELSLHESTISRVTTAKYMATPLGTYELKYFFGSSLGTETGGNASSTAVRALIRQFVAAENTRKPLSDSQISSLLKDHGIECARRTVAKYRDALRIAPANLRKAL